jgi:hypothetical protein
MNVISLHKEIKMTLTKTFTADEVMEKLSTIRFRSFCFLFLLPGGREAGNFSLHHRLQNGSESHPASYPMGTRCSFSRGKAVGA